MHQRKTEAEHIRKENHRLIRLQAENVKQRVLDAALAEHDELFYQAIAEGGLVKLETTPGALKAMVLESAQRTLGA